MKMLCIAALLTVSACSKTPFVTRVIQVDGRDLVVEIAYTNSARAQGVMGKTGLTDEQGVFFMYPDQRNIGFWMKTVTFPLDIAFVRSDGTIARIAQMQPYVTTSTPSLQPVQFALEMREGWFADRGVVVGEKITGIPTDLEPEPR
ncbi:MAG: uncharacterized membrane protein (UPF0127 family) [Myxococcota bacterium]|jgi:uncharacterized membrane protein (UPF0127 family)